MACNVQDSPEMKKPCKGILKTSSSLDKPSMSVSAGYRKSAKFDELNVLQTYHPPDKDYGHMIIDEPKTPYNYAELDEGADQLDADLLAEKLKMVTSRTSPDTSDNEDDLESDDQKMKRIEFEKRRKLHYNEFEAVRLARKLMEEDDEDDDDADVDATDKCNVDAENCDEDGEYYDNYEKGQEMDVVAGNDNKNSDEKSNNNNNINDNISSTSKNSNSSSNTKTDMSLPKPSDV